MLTVEEIKARATSPREALLVSIEKWTETARLSPEELKELSAKKIRSDYCGLCWWYGGSDISPLCDKKGNGNCMLREKVVCCEAWQNAKDTLANYQDEKNFDVSKVYVVLWQMVSRLESELAKLPPEEKKEEPKLRHGDYGDEGHAKWIKIYDKIWWLSGQKTQSSIDDLNFINSKKGNIETIFDDLAALQEDVEEYKGKDRDGDSFRIHFVGDWIRIEIAGEARDFSIEGIEEPILKLRQMLATAKRIQFKKGEHNV